MHRSTASRVYKWKPNSPYPVTAVVSSQMQHPALEIYAGDVAAIRAACAADRLDDLREGKVTPYLATFPSPFTASDISLVETALAAILGRSEPLEIERTEEDGGLFVDRIATPWVASVQRLALPVRVFFKQNGVVPTKQENEQPEWSSTDHLALLTQFINVCRKAKDAGLDLVMVWLL